LAGIECRHHPAPAWCPWIQRRTPVGTKLIDRQPGSSGSTELSL
jgi:hypothetical protein